MKFQTARHRFTENVIPNRLIAFLYGVLLGATIMYATHELWSAPHYTGVLF